MNLKKGAFYVTDRDLGHFLMAPIQAAEGMKSLGLGDNNKQESTLTSKILPIFRIMHWFNIFPGSFELGKDGTAVFKSPSLLRKIVNIVFQALVIVQVLGSALWREQAVQPTALKIMYRVVTASYISFYAVFNYTMSSKGAKLQSLMEKIRDLEGEFATLGLTPRNSKKERRISNLIVAIYFGVTLIFVTFIRFPISHISEGFVPFIKLSSARTTTQLSVLLRLNFEEDLNEMLHPVAHFLIFLLTFLMSFLYDFCWIFGYLMNTVWGLIFSKLFSIYYRIAPGLEARYGNKDIEIFNTITFLLAELNDIYSPAIIGAIFSGVLHFSIHIFVFVTKYTPSFLTVITLLSFGIFWFQLIAMAHVHYSAQKMVQYLKTRQHNKMVLKHGTHHHRDPERLEALVVLMNELQMGNVGFQGWGFFTVSYSFIGSVLSLIATYAIVVMQIQGSGT